VSVALGVVFVLASGFYLWTAATSSPLTLHGGAADRYNLLAGAFLHLRLSIGPAPAALLHLSNPYDPHLYGGLVGGVNDATSINDDVLYHGQLYFVWGPAPAIVLLVPLHLLGLEPSASVTVAFYAIIGLGFALATLRVLIRQLGNRVPIWMCTLAGLALSLSSVLPFALRAPGVTQDVLAGGYCFMMAGAYLAMSALTSGQASWRRLVLMSLCFGLAAGSRITLAPTALVLIPVYMRLRSGGSRRRLMISLAVPVGVCLSLLLAYNQARFDSPLNLGSNYQLTAYDARSAPYGHVSYLLPGAGFYGLTLPRSSILFPFLALAAPDVATPVGLARPAATGGLLPMTPIVALVVLLPWLWRRRPAALGPLALPLLILVGAGILSVLLASFEFYASTERYEIDFATLFLLGGLAVWMSLARGAGRTRRLLRIGGGVLVAWGCLTGLATSFVGEANLLETGHTGTWRTLERIGSPISTAMADVVGHPVLARVQAQHVIEDEAGRLKLASSVTEISLASDEGAGLTIVSPDARSATLLATVTPLAGTDYGVSAEGADGVSYGRELASGNGRWAIPLSLKSGLNRFMLSPVATGVAQAGESVEAVRISDLSIESAR
jgi:hypothetical protein